MSITSTEHELSVATLHVVLRDPKPISINRAYAVARNRKFLTKEGKEYVAAMKDAASRATQNSEVLWKTVVDSIYKYGGHVALEIVIYFPDLHNSQWNVGGGQTEGGGIRSPYKKKDASNYTKLIEDAIAQGTGIDDSANMDVRTIKRESKTDPRVEVTYKVFE